MKTSNASSEIRTFEVPGVGTCSCQVTNIDCCPALSDETLAFGAEFVVKAPGREARFSCGNRGCGGPTDIGWYGGENADLYEKLDEYLRTVVDEEMTAAMRRWGMDQTCYMSVESLVDNLVCEWADARGL